jgi:hypothetical protein
VKRVGDELYELCDVCKVVADSIVGTGGRPGLTRNRGICSIGQRIHLLNLSSSNHEACCTANTAIEVVCIPEQSYPAIRKHTTFDLNQHSTFAQASGTLPDKRTRSRLVTSPWPQE